VEPALTPEQRSQRSRIGGLTLHAGVDSAEHTKPARAAFLAKFEQQVDPEGLLTPQERQRRALLAKRAYFVQLAYRSSQVRAHRKQKAAGGRRPETAGAGRERVRPAR